MANGSTAELQLSDSDSFDLSKHYNLLLPCPAGWDISKRNAQVLIYNPECHVIRIDSTRYEMLRLAKLHGPVSTPPKLFLRVVLASCFQQRTADMDYHVQWTRHLLTCLRNVLEATCLVGERAVTFPSSTSTPRTPQILIWDLRYVAQLNQPYFCLIPSFHRCKKQLFSRLVVTGKLMRSGCYAQTDPRIMQQRTCDCLEGNVLD